ncbi:MAG: c-type cytochrome [Chloroflexi bacterium]|nr:c-type cytochrome [Chloroflexota bacterium]
MFPTKHLPTIFLLTLALCLLGCNTAAPTPPPTPTPTAAQKLGQTAFMQNCGSCHSVADEAIIVGPSLKGVGNRAAERVPGQDARTYLMTSILNPSAYLVEGFQDGLMPANLAKKLTGEELDGVIEYLLTLE